MASDGRAGDATGAIPLVSVAATGVILIVSVAACHAIGPAAGAPRRAT